MPADAKWYVVHTYSGYENKVATNIEKVVNNRKMEDQILEVKIPIEIAESPVEKQITTIKIDKKGESKEVTDFKIALGKKIEKATLVSKEIKGSNSGVMFGDTKVIGTMVIETENHEKATLNIVDVSRKPNGEEVTTVQYLRKETERKLFPGYVFIKVAVTYDDDDQPYMSDDAWGVIRHTRGVTGFVGPDSKPAPLSDEEVLKFGVERHVIKVNYNVGDRVTIIDDIFDGFPGVVEEIDADNNRVKVKVSALFGKETLVELALDQVVVDED